MANLIMVRVVTENNAAMRIALCESGSNPCILALLFQLDFESKIKIQILKHSF